MAEPSVFVIDDDIAVLSQLSHLFGSRGLRVCTFRTVREFFASRKPSGPACLVLEAGLPDGPGLELQRQLVEAGVDLPIVFMARRADIRLAVGAMKAGALDFLLKPLHERELLDAVQRALKHDAEAICRRVELAELLRRQAKLTIREREVLVRIVSGRLNKQVAAELAIAEGTVKVYRRRLMKKMSAASLADLVRMSDRISDGPGLRFQGLTGECSPRFARQAKE